MGIFDFLRGPSIDEGVNEFASMSGAILIDARTPDEYKEGHIEGSKNIPLQNISRAKKLIKDKETPLFVYCLSGSRSRQACSHLEQMGYSNVKNIGGISSYHGKMVR